MTKKTIAQLKEEKAFLEKVRKEQLEREQLERDVKALKGATGVNPMPKKVLGKLFSVGKAVAKQVSSDVSEMMAEAESRKKDEEEDDGESLL